MLKFCLTSIKPNEFVNHFCINKGTLSNNCTLLETAQIKTNILKKERNKKHLNSIFNLTEWILYVELGNISSQDRSAWLHHQVQCVFLSRCLLDYISTQHWFHVLTNPSSVMLQDLVENQRAKHLLCTEAIKTEKRNIAVLYYCLLMLWPFFTFCLLTYKFKITQFSFS